MKYILEINISTDGDFSFPFVPIGMEHDPGSTHYDFKKVYNDMETAVKDTSVICAFLKEHLYSSRDWVKELFNQHVDSFVRQVNNIDTTLKAYAYECIYGNYDGTTFQLYVQPNVFNFSLALTDQEYDLVRSNRDVVSIKQIKKAILSLFEEAVNAKEEV